MDSQDFNIILVNIDGFRKDKIPLCPTLQNIQENSVYFSHMNTVAPYTFASLHAVFSGLYPSKNGVNGYYNIFKFKKNEITTLAQHLKNSGYYTCADIISESVMPKQGIDEWNIFDEESVNFQEGYKQVGGLSIPIEKSLQFSFPLKDEWPACQALSLVFTNCTMKPFLLIKK